MIDGVEARLGSPAFCGVADADAMQRRRRARRSSRSRMAAHGRAFAVRQTLRPDAVAVVDALRARGLELMILSGDRRDAVAPVARRARHRGTGAAA